MAGALGTTDIERSFDSLGEEFACMMVLAQQALSAGDDELVAMALMRADQLLETWDLVGDEVAS